MTRMEEYKAMREQLMDSPAEASGTLKRAKARRRRSRMLWRPLTSLAIAVLCFAAIVNLSPSVAIACMDIPLLDKLIQAVSFSPSLKLAVENDYMQLLGQSQTKNEITARVEYLIVDQKKLEVFYTLNTELDVLLIADPTVRNSDGTEAKVYISSDYYGEGNGDFRSMTIEYGDDESVPDQLMVGFRVYADSTSGSTEKNAWQPADGPGEPENREYLAEFEFLLEFDPTSTEQGRIVSVNREADLNGEKITITSIEVYPTHMRINIVEDAENSARIMDLDFYVELEDGTRIVPIQNGVAASRSLKTPFEVSYRAESSYFSDQNFVRLVITSALFLDKDEESLWMDLATGESEPLPQGVQFHSAEHFDWGWLLIFYAELLDNTHRSPFSQEFYDADGEKYTSSRYGCSTGGEKGMDEHIFYLEGYNFDEIWLVPSYTHYWSGETPVEISMVP